MNIYRLLNIRYMIREVPLAFLLLASCGGGNEGSESDVPLQKDVVKLSQQQVKVAELAFGKIEKQLLSFDVSVKGKIVLPPQNDVSVSAFSACTVEKIHVTAGEAVKKGDLLATIVSPSIISLQKDFASSAARLEMVKKEYERQKLLNIEKISAEKKLEESVMELGEATSVYESLKLQLELLNIVPDQVLQGKLSRSAFIVSPISGFVEEVLVNAGLYVAPEEPLFRIISAEKLYLELMIFEKDVPFIKNGQRVTFKLANLGGEEYDATLLSLGHSVEENARAVKALAQMNSRSGVVLPGMFVSAEIHTDEQYLDALPEEAIVSEDGNSTWVYYTVSPSSAEVQEFRKAPVRTGFREDGFIHVELLTQIPVNARIVTKGAYFIKAEGFKQAE